MAGRNSTLGLSEIYIPLSAIFHVGCGRCWSLDGNWKLGFVHCMDPVKSKVQGFPLINYPDVCTQEPVPGKAFCLHHCSVAYEKGVPSKLRDYLDFKSGKGLVKCYTHRFPTNPNIRGYV